VANILINSFSFLLTILIAFGLKKVGLFKQEDGKILAKIFVYITLPATIIVGLNGTRFSLISLGLIGIGFIVNVILAFIGYFVGRNQSVEKKGMTMLMVSSLNIGGFGIPFIQLFLPSALVYAGVFDIGNSLMVTGGTLVMTEEMTKKEKAGFAISDIVKKLASSPIFMVYLLMVIVSIFGLTIPEPALPPLRFLASANSFLSMFTIGLFLRVNLHKDGWATVRRILLTRYTCLILFAVGIYFFLPVSLFLRQVLVLLFLAPIANLAVLQAAEFSGDEGMCGLVSSLAIMISLALMSGAMLLMS